MLNTTLWDIFSPCLWLSLSSVLCFQHLWELSFYTHTPIDPFYPPKLLKWNQIDDLTRLAYECTLWTICYRNVQTGHGYRTSSALPTLPLIHCFRLAFVRTRRYSFSHSPSTHTYTNILIHTHLPLQKMAAFMPLCCFCPPLITVFHKLLATANVLNMIQEYFY